MESIDPLVPQQEEVLGRASLLASVSPIRRAFLVPEGDPDALKQVMVTAASLWGGPGSPILPVSDTGTIAPGHAQFAHIVGVEEIYNFTNRDDNSLKWPEEYPALRERVRPARPHDRWRHWAPHFIVRVFGSGELIVPQGDTLLDAAGAGILRDPDELKELQDLGMEVTATALATDTVLAQLQNTAITSYSLDGDTVRMQANPFMTSVAFIVVAESSASYDDCLYFWNMRAVRARSARTGVSLLVDRETIGDPELRTALLRTIGATAAASDPNCFINSVSLPKTELSRIARKIGLRAHSGPFAERLFGGTAPDGARLTRGLNVEARSFWLGERVDGNPVEVDVSLKRPTITFTIKPQPDLNAYAGGMVNLQLESDFLKGPHTAEVAALYHEHAEWGSRGLRIRIAPYGSLTMSLSFPTATAVLDAALTSGQAAYDRSDKARQVDGVMATDINWSIYATKEFYAIANALTPKPNRDFKKVLTDILEHDLHADVRSRLIEASISDKQSERSLAEIYGLAGKFGCANADWDVLAVVLERMIDGGLATRGYRIDCSVCQAKEFVDVERSQYPVRCLGCGSPAHYYREAGKEVSLFYRASTLLRRLVTNGGLVPLAATAHLRTQGAWVVPGAIVKGGGDPWDADLLGWASSDLFTGEAKTSNLWFTDDKIREDLQHAGAIGASKHYFVCALPLDGAQESAMVRESESMGIRLEMLSGDQLLRPASDVL